MKKIQIIKNNDERVSTPPLINIITRTSARPNYFENNYDSIKAQTYSNIKHWVIYDEDKTYTDYLRFYNDIELVKVDKQTIQEQKDIKNPNTGLRFFYNLYFNEVIKQIRDGWILILDDDDSLAHENVIKRLVNLIKYNTDMLIFQMKYLNGRLLPSDVHFYKKPMLGAIGSPCVLVHHKIAKMHKWDGWKCADYRYIDKCWKNSSRKIWIKEPMISIGSMNGNLGKKNDMVLPQTKKKEKVDLIFVIPTYNRYEMLRNLITSLTKEKTDVKHKVFVLDDASNNHLKNKEVCSNIDNLVYDNNKHNNGKKMYWKTFNTMLNFAKKYQFKHLVQIDDDFDLCENFIDRINNLSDKHNNSFVRYINTGSPKLRWDTVNWVDGGTMIPYSFLQRIKFKIDPIPYSRWNYAPHLSSGVWQQITEKLVKYKYKTIHLKKSLVKHLGYKDSRMNKEMRKKNNIFSKNFIDEK